MTIKEAIELITHLRIEPEEPQLWADLGCGTGLFSRALAELLPPQSRILCLDTARPGWESGDTNNVALEFIKADFSKYEFENAKFDGFMMANSLHYIKNKPLLLNRLVPALRPNGRIAIVEYDSESANFWVPYPITFEKLKSLFLHYKITKIAKIGERSSRFGRMMYCCEIRL
jgi:ubiquinone/menaquinone biosynthesis C-methylase UbiE